MLPFDQEGRVLLPEVLRTTSALKSDALFVGMGRKFRIWNLMPLKNMKKKQGNI